MKPKRQVQEHKPCGELISKKKIVQKKLWKLGFVENTDS
jgi:hypothetical protein